MATNASASNSIRSPPLFVYPTKTAKNRHVPQWQQLDRRTREDLLALLTQMVGHHIPTSFPSDERGVPDEPH
jgi:hypothetical protein